MKLSLKKFDWPQKLFLCLCGFQLLVNFIWITLDTQIPAWDQAGHTRIALEFLDNWAQPFQEEQSVWQISSYYPPLMHWQAAFLMRFFGRNPDWGNLLVAVYNVILLVGVYKLTNRLWQNRWAGLTAATLVAFMPVIYTNSRWFLLDIPLLAFTVWSWYFLWQSKLFTKRRVTIFFALAAAAMLLTKWTGIVFLLVPLVFVFIKIGQKKSWPKVWRNLCLAILIILILVAPWYLVNFHSLLNATQVFSVGEIDDPQILWSIENWRFYLWTFLNFQVGFFPGVALLVGTGIYFAGKNNQYRALSGSLLVFIYLVFSFLSNKDLRYDLPILVVMAMLTAVTILQLWQQKQKFWSFLLIFFTIIWQVILYFSLSFHLLPDYQFAVNFGPFGWVDLINTTDTVVAYPQEDLQTNALIVEDLEKLAKGNKVKILVDIDQKTLSASTLHYWSRWQKFDNLTFITVPADLNFNDAAILQSYLNNFDYFIIAADVTGVSASRALANLDFLQEYLLNNHRFINKITYEGGDGKIFLLAQTQS